MRATPLLLTLLLVASVVVSLAIYSLARGARVGLGEGDDFVWGLAFAQIQLASAGMVFLRRRLTLRVTVLTACVLLWSFIASTPTTRPTFDNAIILLGVGIHTAMWCGVMRFFGWQLVAGEVETADENSRGKQFSLATLLIATTIAGIYGGLLRFTALDLREVLALLVVAVLCSIIGCTLLTITAHWSAWLFWSLPLAALLAASEYDEIGELISAEIVLPIALVQSAFIGATIMVLRVAGIRMVGPSHAGLRAAKGASLRNESIEIPR